MKLRSLALAACALAFAAVGYGQTYDCRILFSISVSGTNTAPYDNRSNGCDSWTMVYQANNLTGLTLTVQSAFGAITAGTFGTFTGTVVSGINPNTSTTGAQTILTGFNSFIRVTATFTNSGGALINGVLYGYHSGFSGAGNPSCPGTAATPCVVDGPVAAGSAPTKAPVLVAGEDGAPGSTRTLKTDANGQPIPANGTAAGADGISNTVAVPEGAAGAPLWFRVLPSLFDGTNNNRQFTCPFQAVQVLAPGTTGRLVLGVVGTATKICHYHLSDDTAANVTITSGTGTNCGTGTATIDSYTNVTQFAMDFSPLSPLKANALGDDICYTFSVSVANASIEVIYAQF